MSHIILVTHWTGGDVLPFIRFGKQLLDKGHRVTLFSHCIYEKRAKEVGIEFVPLDTPKLYEEMNNDLHMLADPIHNKQDCIYFQNKYHGEKRLVEECKLIESYCEQQDTIILARHRSSVAGMLAAERKGLPYASVILAPNYFSHMDLHQELMGKEIEEEINKARKLLDLEPVSSWKHWLYSPEYILGVWPEWFAEPDETWPSGVQAIGYMRSDEEEAEQTYGEKVDDLLAKARLGKEPVVLITGGSSKMVSPKFYETAIRAVEKTGYKGIVVTPYEEMIPKDLSGQIIWVKRVPLASLMKQIDIIIHHGGMGTLSEAIDAAIPQIIMPHLTDGPDNAQRAEKLGIAKKFAPSKWQVDEIAQAIKESIQDETKERCALYEGLNKQVYKQKEWEEILTQIKPYKYIPQVTNKDDKKADINKASKAQLLALLRRKKREA